MAVKHSVYLQQLIHVSNPMVDIYNVHIVVNDADVSEEIIPKR